MCGTFREPGHWKKLQTLRHKAALALLKTLKMLQLRPSCRNAMCCTFAVLDYWNTAREATGNGNDGTPAEIAGVGSVGRSPDLAEVDNGGRSRVINTHNMCDGREMAGDGSCRRSAEFSEAGNVIRSAVVTDAVKALATSNGDSSKPYLPKF